MLAKEREFFYYINNEDYKAIDKTLENNSDKIWEYKDKERDNCSVLHATACLDNFEMLRTIVNYCKCNLSPDKFTAFINGKDKKGLTPLHFASYKGNVKVLEFLIFNGADINAQNDNFLNVLHYAAQGNEPNSLYFFKKKGFVNFNCTDSVGSTPLHWACYKGSEQASKYLLQYGADINALDNENSTPLHRAVLSKNLKFVKNYCRQELTRKLKTQWVRLPMT